MKLKDSELREVDIERAVCLYARTQGYLTYKFTSPARRSVPDRLFITPDGLTLFIEFKRPGNQLTKQQAAECHRLAEQGCNVYVCHTIEQGRRVVDAFLDPEHIIEELKSAGQELSAHLSRAGHSPPH